MNIPLIIPYYNQPTYAHNLINWWYWYGGGRVFLLDNASNTVPHTARDIEIVRFERNTARANLASFLRTLTDDYYVISDPDIMPHPSCPPDFLDILHHAVAVEGLHHAGLALETDIPEWVPPIIRDDALRNEASFKDPSAAFTMDYHGRKIPGHRAPIDTTFALYSRANGGWQSPMPGPAWSHSARFFRAFHLGWYIPEHPNAEMDHYFKTCNGPHHHHGVTLRNTYHPAKYADRYHAEHAKSKPEDVV